MRLLALVSGGKDSILSILMSQQYGHEVVALLNVRPAKDFAEKNEESNGGDVDSHCFQTVGHQLLDGLAECMNLPLFRTSIGPNPSVNQDLVYREEADKIDDEVEILFNLVKSTCEKFAAEGKPIGGLCSGAILSNYQRLRVERICQRLKLSSFSFLWQRPALNVLRLVQHFSLHAILIKVASFGLKPTFLGKSLIAMTPTLTKLHRQNMCHAAGEGGEFESVVLDCPGLFSKQNKTLKIRDGSLKTVGADVKCGSGEGTIVFDVDVVESGTYKDEVNESSEKREITTTTTDSDASYFDITGFNGYISVNECENILFAEVSEERTAALRALLKKTQTIQQEEQSKFADEDCCLNFSLYNSATTNLSKEHKQPLSVGEQAKSILTSNLDENSSEASKSKVLYTLVQGSEFKYFADVNASYLDIFGRTVPPPSRAFVGCGEDATLKISVVAVKNDSSNNNSNTNNISRNTLHVQSISNWAAACIGPYAQSQSLSCSCRKCQEYREDSEDASRATSSIILTSGTIGLEPPSMVLAGSKEGRYPAATAEEERPEICLFQECVMTLANVHAILQRTISTSCKTSPELGLEKITHGTIFFAKKRIGALVEANVKDDDDSDDDDDDDDDDDELKARCLSIFDSAWKVFAKRVLDDTTEKKKVHDRLLDNDEVWSSGDDEDSSAVSLQKERVFDAEIQHQAVKIAKSIIVNDENDASSFAFNLRVVLVETLPRDAAVEFIVGVANNEGSKDCESKLATVAISKFFAATQF